MCTPEQPTEVVWLTGTGSNVCIDQPIEDLLPRKTFVPEVPIKTEPDDASYEGEDPELQVLAEPKPSKFKPESNQEPQPALVKDKGKTKSKVEQTPSQLKSTVKTKAKEKAKPLQVEDKAKTKPKEKPEPSPVQYKLKTTSKPEPLKPNKQCPICQKIILKMSHLKDHIAAHSTDKDQECPVCKKKFNKPGLRAHMVVHKKPYQCPHCDYVVTKRPRFEQHLQKHLTEKQHYCPDCDKRFLKSSDLETHMKLTHSASADPGLVCKICSKVFNFKRRLQKHLDSHNVEDLKGAGIKLHACSMCHMCFIQFSDLKDHLNQIHDKDPEKKTKKQYPCPDCELVFPTILLLNDHLAEHTGREAAPRCQEEEHTVIGEQFNCTKCEEKFSLGRALKLHYLKAHREKDQCAVCGKMTNYLSHHISRFHSGERLCKVCGETCKNANALMNHMKRHKEVDSSNPSLLSPRDVLKTFL